LDLTIDAQTQLKNSLNQTVSYARHLQTDIFGWAVPVSHIVLFAISSIMLGVGATNAGPKRAYKTVLVIAVLMAAFSLALVFTSTLGTQQAINALVDGESNKDQLLVTDITHGSEYLLRGKALSYVQGAQLTFVTLFFVSMGIMYIGEKPQKAVSHV
jgi:hypothetical protein